MTEEDQIVKDIYSEQTSSLEDNRDQSRDKDIILVLITAAAFILFLNCLVLAGLLLIAWGII